MDPKNNWRKSQLLREGIKNHDPLVAFVYIIVLTTGPLNDHSPQKVPVTIKLLMMSSGVNQSFNQSTKRLI